MDLLDRLLMHDAWTTHRLLELCASLSDEQLDHEYPIGLGTLRRTFIHVVFNAEAWTDVIKGAAIRPGPPADASIALLLEHFEQATDELYEFARRIVDEGRLDDTFIDDDPPRCKSYGAGILHVATHGMHHRAQLLYMMRRLGIDDIPEGDALGWENQQVGGWKTLD